MHTELSKCEEDLEQIQVAMEHLKKVGHSQVKVHVHQGTKCLEKVGCSHLKVRYEHGTFKDKCWLLLKKRNQMRTRLKEIHHRFLIPGRGSVSKPLRDKLQYSRPT